MSFVRRLFTSKDDVLFAENERIKADLDALQQKYNRTQADLAALQQKYDLVSGLLEAKPSENEAFEEFKKVFNEDFMAFANKESSLADEVTAVQRLQTLEKRLEQFVAFPHTFAKRSIAIGGGFSSGKSAFINSFITDPGRVLPEGITPVTAIPSYVMASTKISIKGCVRNGATVDVAPELYEQLSHDSQSSRDSMVAFRHLMPAIAVEVPLRAGFEHICLIDTPGYDSAGGQTGGDEATAAESLKDEDAALIWMISAESGTVPEADLDFIEDLELNGRPFYVVLTKADLKPASDLEDILAEVKATLADRELKPVGISAYSSLRDERGRADPSDGLSLSDFFRSQNQPVENLGAKLKGELESVFSMYEKAIEQDEQRAKSLRERLEELNLDLNEKVDADVAEEFGEKIDEIKQSQSRDFAPIKQELERVKQAMFEAVKQVLLSLVDDPKSAAELNAVWQQQGRAKRHSQSTHPRQPADTQSKDAPDPYALHEAAKIDDYKKATALLNTGADPNAEDEEGWTPLHYAAWEDAHRTVEVLLDNRRTSRVKINSKDEEGWTPLHYAAEQDARQTVKVLLAKGADPNVKGKNGATPLHYAAWEDAHRTVEVLLDNRRTSRVKINSKDEEGWTPLHYAAEQDARQTVKVLLAKGAFLNVKGKNGATPLDFAVENNAHETARLLRSSGGLNSG